MSQKETNKRMYGPSMDEGMRGMSDMGRGGFSGGDFGGGAGGSPLRNIGGSGLSIGRVGTGVTGSMPGSRTMGRGYGVTGNFQFSEGGKVSKPKKKAKGGSAASKRADGCATKGKTKGRFV